MMIRNATVMDISSMVYMAELLHAHSRFKQFNFDKQKMNLLITNLIDRDFGIAIVMEHESIIQGGILGMVAEHYFGKDKTSTDMGLFVRPGSRNASIATELIKEYVTQAKEKGAIDICIGNTTGYELELTGKLYESSGFKKIGEVYCLGDN